MLTSFHVCARKFEPEPGTINLPRSKLHQKDCVKEIWVVYYTIYSEKPIDQRFVQM